MSIRRGDVGDLELVLAIQREASLAGLANVFPPDRFPYPEDEVREDLRAQLEDPRYVALVDSDGRGFVMVSDGWLQRLYVRAGAWGGRPRTGAPCGRARDPA